MFTPKPYGSNSKTIKICYPPLLDAARYRRFLLLDVVVDSIKVEDGGRFRGSNALHRVKRTAGGVTRGTRARPGGGASRTQPGVEGATRGRGRGSKPRSRVRTEVDEGRHVHCS